MRHDKLPRSCCYQHSSLQPGMKSEKRWAGGERDGLHDPGCHPQVIDLQGFGGGSPFIEIESLFPGLQKHGRGIDCNHAKTLTHNNIASTNACLCMTSWVSQQVARVRKASFWICKTEAGPFSSSIVWSKQTEDISMHWFSPAICRGNLKSEILP